MDKIYQEIELGDKVKNKEDDLVYLYANIKYNFYTSSNIALIDRLYRDKKRATLALLLKQLEEPYNANNRFFIRHFFQKMAQDKYTDPKQIIKLIKHYKSYNLTLSEILAFYENQTYRPIINKIIKKEFPKLLSYLVSDNNKNLCITKKHLVPLNEQNGYVNFKLAPLIFEALELREDQYLTICKNIDEIYTSCHYQRIQEEKNRSPFIDSPNYNIIYKLLKNANQLHRIDIDLLNKSFRKKTAIKNAFIILDNQSEVRNTSHFIDQLYVLLNREIGESEFTHSYSFIGNDKTVYTYSNQTLKEHIENIINNNNTSTANPIVDIYKEYANLVENKNYKPIDKIILFSSKYDSVSLINKENEINKDITENFFTLHPNIKFPPIYVVSVKKTVQENSIIQDTNFPYIKFINSLDKNTISILNENIQENKDIIKNYIEGQDFEFINSIFTGI